MNCSMWSHGVCSECDLFKGRGGECNGYPDTAEQGSQDVFEALSSARKPAGRVQKKQKKEPDIKLLVVDAENDQVRPSSLKDARTWDWKNPEIMRIVDDWQISSYEMLLFILKEKAEKGIKEVRLFEAPRFMVLAGG